MFGRNLADFTRPIFAGVEDAMIGAQLTGLVELGLMSAGDDRLATEVFGDVEASQRNPAADPCDQHRLPGAKMRAADQHAPGRQMG